MGQNSNNYHWKDLNISSWVESKISEELLDREYEVQRLVVDTKVCQRMSKLGLVYDINFDLKKGEKAYYLQNYTSSTDPAEGLETVPWFRDFFKELECKAILQFADKLLDTEKAIDREVSGIKKTKADEQKCDSVKLEFTMTCKAEEIINFMTKPEFISMWSRNEAIFSGDEVKIQRIVMRDVKCESHRVTMLWKLDTWCGYSNLEITLSEIQNVTKVSILQTQVPIDELDIVKGGLTERMFMPICMCFGFTMKQLN